MPPFLASCLTLAFILWLFHRNTKAGPHTTKALWLAVIWVCALAARPIGSWFDAGVGAGQTVSVEEGSPIDRSILLVLIISALFVLMRRGLSWSGVIRRNPWLWLFYAFLLVSVLWSDYPFVAFKRWFRDFGNLVIILLVLSEENPGEAVRQVFLRCAYVLIPISVLFIKYYLDLGRYYNEWTGETGFCGVTSDKNALGRLAMLSGFIILWSLLVRQRSGWLKWVKEGLPELLILAMCLWILHIANSQTAVGCFVIGTAVLLGTRMNWVRVNPVRLAWLSWTLLVISFLFFYLPDLRQVVTSSMGRNVNLTDRTDVWAETLAVGTNPLIGTGFASFWLTSAGHALGERLNVTEAHNGFLEIYLNEGLIGIGLLLPVLLAAGRSTLKQIVAGNAAASLVAALFFSGIVYNYTEAAFGNGSVVAFALWLVAMQDSEHAVAEVPEESGQTEPYPASETKLGACR